MASRKAFKNMHKLKLIFRLQKERERSYRIPSCSSGRQKVRTRNYRNSCFETRSSMNKQTHRKTRFSETFQTFYLLSWIKRCFRCTSFIVVLLIFWLSVIILQGFMQFFSFRGLPSQNDAWMKSRSGNRLSMECDLCLRLHINLHIFPSVSQKRKYICRLFYRQTRDFSVVYV